MWVPSIGCRRGQPASTGTSTCDTYMRYDTRSWLGPRIYFGGALAVAFVRVEYLGTLTWRVSASFVSMKKAIKALH